MIKILLCAPIHEKEEIFNLYLEHIRSLNIPSNVQLDKLFILHNCETLKKCLKNDERFLEYKNITSYEKTEKNHVWRDGNFKDVVSMKNYLIEYALTQNYDYIFFVDSDLMLHKETLNSLLNANKDMIAEIFWTKWDNQEQAMPNCWSFDHYQIYDFDFAKWKQKGVYQVGMTGACTLIKRKVLESGVNWNLINNLSMTQWEDRAFCVRAAASGFDIWIDTNFPAIHLYRESEYKKFVEGGGINE